MASVVAIMICEYFLLTKGNVFVARLYDGSRANKNYRYLKGCNVQAIIAYIIGIALPFPGFVGTLGAPVSVSAERLGHMGWLLSFVATFISYYLICLIWPTENQKMIKELGLQWEELSDQEIIAVDGTHIPESAVGGGISSYDKEQDLPEGVISVGGAHEKWS